MFALLFRFFIALLLKLLLSVIMYLDCITIRQSWLTTFACFRLSAELLKKFYLYFHLDETSMRIASLLHASLSRALEK